MTCSATTQPTLDRTVTLPALVFYGLGVAIGAGIFALIGEILGLAGDNAPLSFLVAGILAGFTGVSYMILVGAFLRAGGEAVFVTRGLGPVAGRVAGLAVIITGIVTGAVVALAFAGYIASLVTVPERITAVALVIVLSVVAWWGVRKSVILATVVTLLEVETGPSSKPAAPTRSATSTALPSTNPPPPAVAAEPTNNTARSTPTDTSPTQNQRSTPAPARLPSGPAVDHPRPHTVARKTLTKIRRSGLRLMEAGVRHARAHGEPAAAL